MGTKRTLRNKLTLAFLTVFLVTGFLAFFVLYTYHRTGEEVSVMTEDVIPGALALVDLKAELAALGSELGGFQDTGDATRLRRLSGCLATIGRSAEVHTAHETHEGKGGRRAARDLEERARHIVSLAEQTLKLIQEGGSEAELGTLRHRIDVEREVLVALLDEQVQVYMRELADPAESVHESIVFGIRSIWMGIIIALLLAFAAAFYMAQSVVRPIHSLHRGSQRLGSGEFAFRLDIKTGDEIEQLAEEFNRMAERLSRLYYSLEREVAERTAQLSRTVKKLKTEVTERKRVEAAIKRRLGFEKTISVISSRLLSSGDFEGAINASLRDIGSLTGASRAYVCLFEEGDTRMSNTHEWCAPGAGPPIGNLGNIPADADSWWMGKLRGGETVQFEDISTMPPESRAEKELLQKLGVKSLIVLPLAIRRELSGFVGFHNAFKTEEWRAEDSAIIRVFSDILGNAFERRRTEEQLHSMSIHDELTGLYNRRGFLAVAQEGLKLVNREKKESLLLFADLDNLKQINDTFSHRGGDSALIEVANIIKESFRESDIKARIGGDEFAVFATGARIDFRKLLLAKLDERLRVHNLSGKNPFKLSLSTGVAYYDPESPCSIDELLTRADALMYKQKQEKKTGISSQQVLA
jgi:diguanylate cyclase (GGDEF)-like protein